MELTLLSRERITIKSETGDTLKVWCDDMDEIRYTKPK